MSHLASVATPCCCLLCRALTQAEFEVGKASINATAGNAFPLGIEESVLENTPSDTATVVLLPQTPHLDMQLVSDVGWVDYAGKLQRAGADQDTGWQGLQHIQGRCKSLATLVSLMTAILL